MRAATQSPCEPAALAAAVRVLAYDAYRALTEPRSYTSLAELARRATALRSGLGDHSRTSLGSWLENLARALERAGDDAIRGALNAGGTPHGPPPPACWGIRPAIARVRCVRRAGRCPSPCRKLPAPAGLT
jgi:hypothetical protein